MSDYVPVEIAAGEERLLGEIGRLRVRAWVAEFPEVSQLGSWLDGFDKAARHWAVLRGAEPIAAARMTMHQTIAEVPEAEVYEGLPSDLVPAPIASLNRLVVDPASRGHGLSKLLDLARIEAAEVVGCRSVVANTHLPQRVEQLVKLGFFVAGRGKPHSEWAFLQGLVPVLLVGRFPRSRR